MSLCHTHFLGLSLSQSEGRDPDLSQSESPHLETCDLKIKVSSGLKNPGLRDQVNFNLSVKNSTNYFSASESRLDVLLSISLEEDKRPNRINVIVQFPASSLRKILSGSHEHRSFRELEGLWRFKLRKLI